MPLTKGLDPAAIDYLRPLPYSASAGICSVSDPRGIADPVTGKRYSYDVVPTSPTTFILVREDLETPAIQILAAPPAAAAGTYLTGIMAALYDPTGGAANDRPKVYVLVAISAPPGVQWMSFDVRTEAWDAVLLAPVTTAGGASLVTSVALAHPCGTLGYFFTLNPGIGENSIYVNGNGGLWNNFAGPSNLAVYGKGANNWAYLTGAGGARAAAPAAGSKLIWLPNYPDRLYSNRGGASAVLDFYTISNDTWAAATPAPATIMGQGTEMVTLYEAPGWIAVRAGNPLVAAQSSTILAIEVGGLGFQTVASIEGEESVVHDSNSLIAWWVAGQYFLGVTPHGKAEKQRIQIPMPL